MAHKASSYSKAERKAARAVERRAAKLEVLAGLENAPTACRVNADRFERAADKLGGVVREMVRRGTWPAAGTLGHMALTLEALLEGVES